MKHTTLAYIHNLFQQEKATLDREFIEADNALKELLGNPDGDFIVDRPDVLAANSKVEEIRKRIMQNATVLHDFECYDFR